MDLKDRSLLGEQCSVGGDWIGAPATAVTENRRGHCQGAAFRRRGDARGDCHRRRSARGSHYGGEEIVEVKYMLMDGLDR